MRPEFQKSQSGVELKVLSMNKGIGMSPFAFSFPNIYCLIAEISIKTLEYHQSIHFKMNYLNWTSCLLDWVELNICEFFFFGYANIGCDISFEQIRIIWILISRISNEILQFLPDIKNLRFQMSSLFLLRNFLPFRNRIFCFPCKFLR